MAHIPTVRVLLPIHMHGGQILGERVHHHVVLVVRRDPYGVNEMMVQPLRMDSVDDESLLRVKVVIIDHVQSIVLVTLLDGDLVLLHVVLVHNIIHLFRLLQLSMDDSVVQVFMVQKMDNKLVKVVITDHVQSMVLADDLTILVQVVLQVDSLQVHVEVHHLGLV